MKKLLKTGSIIVLLSLIGSLALGQTACRNLFSTKKISEHSLSIKELGPNEMIFPLHYKQAVDQLKQQNLYFESDAAAAKYFAKSLGLSLQNNHITFRFYDFFILLSPKNYSKGPIVKKIRLYKKAEQHSEILIDAFDVFGTRIIEKYLHNPETHQTRGGFIGIQIAPKSDNVEFFSVSRTDKTLYPNTKNAEEFFIDPDTQWNVTAKN